MLSKKENKYRSKIIAENHLKKDGQRYLDQYVKRKLLTYKTIYLNYGYLHSMLTSYNLSRLGNAIKGFGTSCTKASKAVQVLAASLRRLDDYEKCLQVQK